MAQVLLSVSLAPTAGACLAQVTELLAISYGFEWFLTAYVIFSLTLSVILLIWASHGHKRAELSLSQELADSVATIDTLQQKNDTLTANNEELRQTICGLSGKQQEVPETVTGAINT